MPIPSRFEFENENDQYFWWGPLLDGLSTDLNPIFITDATLTATLKGGDGNPVANFTGIALEYTGERGIYRGHIEETFSTAPGADYTLMVIATAPNGISNKWEIPATVNPHRVK